MEHLLGLALLAGVARWCYKSGKRIGSHKGYRVGRFHRRWRR